MFIGNKKVKIVQYIISVIAMVICLFTIINYMYKESIRLLLIDIRNGFIDSGVYVKICILACVLILLIAFYIWQCMFGTLSLRWNIKIRNRKLKIKNGMFVNRYITFISALSVVVILICIIKNVQDLQQTKTKGMVINSKTIGHSFGKIDEYYYTGALEAFKYNYQKGQSCFEVDMILTSDNKIVLKHDWNYPPQEGISENNVPTEEEFLSKKINDVYTPLSLEQLFDLMLKYEDVSIVTDTKYADALNVKMQFDEFVRIAKLKSDEKLLERVIVQIYNEEMYEIVQKYGVFSNYIFTMYQRWSGEKEELIEVCRFCVNNGIDTIAISYNLYDEEVQAIIDRYHLKLYLHTLNDISEVRQYIDSGVFGVYTDEIMPEQLEEVK